MDYITIDFETANSSVTSACSIGIIIVKNSKIVLEEYYLINPEEEFSSYNTTIHHLTYNDCKNEPTFKELWDKIKLYFNNTIVFAHNAIFDISVLKAMIEKYDLERPSIKFGCTVKIAKKLWKDTLPNVKLNTISKYLEVNHDHHNALSDAKICVDIIERGIKVMGLCDSSELYESLGFRLGIYNQDRFYGSYQMYQRKKQVKILENAKLIDKVICLDGKPSIMTKNMLVDKLLKNGAYVDKGLNLRTDYFVLLGNCKKNKLDYANELVKKGSLLKIIDEKDLLKMID